MKNFNKSYIKRSYLIKLIGCFVVFLFLSNYSFSQSNTESFKVEFVKNIENLQPNELYFNALKIVNKSARAIVGSVTFTGPENWNILAFPDLQTQINPNDTVWIPLRVSPDALAVGGISYVINATFKSKNKFASANTYLTIPKNIKWDFLTNTNNLYFTARNPNAIFKIKLSNKGNTNELIKLDLKLGKLLIFADNKNNESVEFLQLPAFKDTILTQTVTFPKDLSYDEKIRYENSWKESAIRITASTELTEKSAAIVIQKLNSTYSNLRQQNSSPLNIDYQTYNIMSSQEPRSNIRLYGSLLFPNSREFQYTLGLQNLYYNKTIIENFDFDRQLFFNLSYLDKRNKIELGYNVNGGSLHRINGRGIVGVFKVSDKTKLSYAVAQNIFSKSTGEYVGISTSIKKLPITTDFTHEDNTSLKYSASSISTGTGFSFFKNHSISFQLLGSQANYNLASGRDTSVLGYSYKAAYAFKYNKFDFRLNTFNSLHNYIRNSGYQNFNLDAKYVLSDNVLFSLYGNRQSYSTTSYPYNFYSDPNLNSTDYLRLTTSISRGIIIYQFGPTFNGSERQYMNPISNFNSQFKTLQPGIWTSATFKIDNYHSISPNVSVSNLRFYYDTEDPTLDNYSITNSLYYQVGINYYDSNWKLNAYYSSGSSSDLYKSVQIDEKPTVSSSIQLRPSYENYFFNRSVRLSAFLNYAYYMPSGRENTSYNIRYDQFVKGGWNFSLSGYVYSNTRVTEDYGSVSTKDLNFVLGITKSFNIQQPRQKYYNLKTVFYNDLNGDRVKSENEPPVADVKVRIEKNTEVSTGISNIPEVELISDSKGEINYENLPQDSYKLVFNPLVNLESLYFLDGENQLYSNDKTRTLYVPLVESYKIKGKVLVIRDPNSTEGKLSLSGIRITAVGENGANYSALTDDYGEFIISTPNAEKFKVSIKNVFGAQFEIENDEMYIQFIENKTMKVDFVFHEKKRGIEFEDGTALYNFGSFMNTDEVEEAVDEVSIPKVEGKPVAPSVETLKTDNTSDNTSSVSKAKKNYSIELSTENELVDPEVYKKKHNLQQDLYYREENGKYKYYTGSFSSPEAAKTEIAKLGLDGALSVEIDAPLLKKAVPVKAPLIPNAGKANADVVDAAEVSSATGPVLDDAGKNSLIGKIKSDTIIVSGEKNDTIQRVKTYSLDSKVDKDGGLIGETGTVVQDDTKADLPTANQPQGSQYTLEDRYLVTDTLTDGKYFSIQLDAVREYTSPSNYQKKYGLSLPILCVEEDGYFKYLIGKYSTLGSARADISRYGMSGYIILVEDLSK